MDLSYREEIDIHLISRWDLVETVLDLAAFNPWLYQEAD